jgi:hypothetical protein
MAAAKKRRCSGCGGFCGGTGRRGGCKFAANEAKRREDEMWPYAKSVATPKLGEQEGSGG